MRAINISVLAVVLVAAACAPNGGSEAGGSANARASTQGQALAFTGDFKGPLGLQLYSVREAMAADIPGTLARVRALGFREVELAGTYNLTPEQFRQELQRVGLRPTSMHAPYERFRDNLASVLAEAKTFGVEYVGVAWIPHPNGQPFTEQMARQAAADFNRWGRAAREQGLTFFYHVHGYEFRPTPSGVVPMDVMIAATDASDVAYEMDVFWVAHPGVDPAALLRKYPNRWRLMHIKDMRKGTPTPDYSGHAPREADVPIGTGQINYPAVLRAAEEIGLRRYYIEDESREPFTSIPQSLAYLQSVRF